VHELTMVRLVASGQQQHEQQRPSLIRDSSPSPATRRTGNDDRQCTSMNRTVAQRPAARDQRRQPRTRTPRCLHQIPTNSGPTTHLPDDVVQRPALRPHCRTIRIQNTRRNHTRDRNPRPACRAAAWQRQGLAVALLTGFGRPAPPRGPFPPSMDRGPPIRRNYTAEYTRTKSAPPSPSHNRETSRYCPGRTARTGRRQIKPSALRSN